MLRFIFPTVEIHTIIFCFAAFTALYTIPGGLNAVMKTELMQGIVLIVGSCILTWFSLKNSAEYLTNLWSANSPLLKLIRPIDDGSTPWLGLIVGMPVLGIYFWANNQTMVQRVLSAKTVDAGRKGIIAAGFLALLVMFFITLCGVGARHLFPGVKNIDGIYPLMIVNLLPSGLITILLITIFSTLTASLSAILNATSTLVTMDFVGKLSKKPSQRKLVLTGKIVTLLVVIIAAVWAPQIGKFQSLLKYYQEMLSYLAPPIVAVFLVGIFNKRVNAKGAFFGLLSGVVIAIILLFFKPSFLDGIHFLLLVPIGFIICSSVVLLVSYSSDPPLKHQLETTLYKKDDFKADWQSLKKGTYINNYLFWSFLLLIAVAGFWIIF